MSQIMMVDLGGQYRRMREEIDEAILACVESAAYIKGPAVGEFERSFAQYHSVDEVVGCGNGTDALQLALMGLGLKPGDEVIVPSFTYIATAEVIALLGLTPVLVDVCPETFTMTVEHMRPAITERTKAVVPVHLYGQCVDIEPILELSKQHDIAVVEDAAQAAGAEYTFSDGTVRKAGTLGHIGCTSFFPTKNLGCFGDGGAVLSNDVELAKRIRMIASHGQNKKYHHQVIGVNSRLDTLQASVLNVKLRHLDDFIRRRQNVAKFYDSALAEVEGAKTPTRCRKSTHTFHQYTLRVLCGRRDALRQHLSESGIPSVVYYPLPMHRQEAFRDVDLRGLKLENAEMLCEEVLSLPVHTEMTERDMERVASAVRGFFVGSTPELEKI